MKRISFAKGRHRTAYAVVVLLFITACGTADEPEEQPGTTAAGGPTTTAGEAEPDSIADLAACAEGEDPTLTYYNPSGEEPLRPMFDAFQVEYPFLEFDVVGGDPLQAIERIISASRSGDPVGDIMHGGLLEYAAFRDNDVPIINYRPEGESGVPEGFPFLDAPYVVPGFMTFHFGYSTDNVASSDLPTSLQELTEPEWNGRIGIRADQIEWWAGVRAHLGEEAARELGEAIAANGLSVYPGADISEVALATGGLDISINSASYNIVNTIEGGAPVSFSDSDFVVAQPHAVIGLEGSDSPCAVKLFMDWVFTVEGQEVFADVMHALPAREDVNPPAIMSDVCTGDCELVYLRLDMLGDFDALVSEFQDIFVR